MTAGRIRVVAACRLLAVTAAVLAGVGMPVQQALAAPAVITTRPVPDVDPADLMFFVGAINDSGRSLKASSLELVVDGSPVGPPAAMQPLSEWATAAAEASASFRPPVSVGLVYLWVTGLPSGVLDGIQAFFQRIPSRTPVYPTIYGRMRQGRARLTAADVSRLGDVAYLEGYRPNLLDAVRLDLPDLAADPAALKILLLVTDGRDFADPKGEGPGDFAVLGREIRKAGVTPLIVAIPAPEADAAQAAANLRDLHDAAGGFLRALEQGSDIENTLESLGQSVADLQRVRITVPWTWRMFGGSHRLSMRLTAGSGQKLNADLGTVTAVAGGLRWLLVVLVGGVAVAAGGAIFLLRGRGKAGTTGRAGGRAPGRGSPRMSSGRHLDDDDDEGEHDADDDDASDDDGDEIVQAAHDLIRRGASPRRAVDELSRSFPEAVASLATLDPEFFQDPRFPYFRTRPGRMRMQEIKEILAKKSADVPAISPGLASVLAEAVEKGTPAEQAAEMLTARVGAEEWTAFAGMDLERLAEALKGSSRGHPLLGRPRARGVAVAIQDALRAGSGTRGVLVGWLVRTGGPGRRGETIRMGGEGRTVLGNAPGASVRITGDGTVAPEHAAFTIEGGTFVVSPLGGSISVEGNQVTERQVLTDGETIGIGAGLYIFKSGSAGNLSSTGGASSTGGGGGGGRRRAVASTPGRSISQRG